MTDRIESAVETANEWVTLAAPAIREQVNLDEMAGRFLSLVVASRKGKNYREPDDWQTRLYREMMRPVEKARDELLAIIDALRDSAITDVYAVFYPHEHLSEDELLANERDYETVRASVVTVDAAIHAMINEMDQLAEEARYG